MTLTENLYLLRKTLLADASYYLGTNFKTFPYDYFSRDLGKDCGADTDLYQCAIANNGVEIKFSVEVFSADDNIFHIDTHSCDILVNNKIYDCIDIDNKKEFEEALSKIINDSKTMNNYEVSVPLFLCPYVKVEAKDEKEAKEVAGKLIMSIINSEFPKNDCRTIDGGGMDSKEWKVTKIDTENEKAIEVLKKNEISIEYFKSAKVCEIKEIENKRIEYIYLDFDERLNDANLCYLRVFNEALGYYTNYFLANPEGGYPATIEEAKTYVWVDEENNLFFLNDNFQRIHLVEGMDKDITYLRACELNKMFDYEGIVVLIAGDKYMHIRPFYDDKKVAYKFTYNDKADIKPSEGMKYEKIEIERK